MQLPKRAKSTSSQTATPSTAARLAPEVLLLILAHLRSPAADMAIRTSGEIPRVDRALAVSPRICRVWSAAATHELYFSVALPTVEACAHFLRSLKANPALGASVRRISLPLCSACSSGTSATRSRLRCRAADIFSEILIRLPSLKAARVQDTHVSARAIYGALSRVQELSIDNGYSSCVTARHPQLIYSGRCMPSLRRLNLLGSPWELPAPGDGADYYFPTLCALSMAGIDASANDIQSLLIATTSLRVLELDNVRTFVGPCSACFVVPLAVLTAPLSGMLQTLQLRRMSFRGRLDPLPDVQHLEVDMSFRRTQSTLPPSLKTLTLLISENHAFEQEPDHPVFAQDPFDIAGELLSWVSRRTSPALCSVTIHVDAASWDRVQTWRHTEGILAKVLAEDGISLWLTATQDSLLDLDSAAEGRKMRTKTTSQACGSTWLSRRRVFCHMQKLLRAL